MPSDEILAKEAQLMYQQTPGFTPVNGDLTHWRGKINIREGGIPNVEIDIQLPEEYPKKPPKVICLTPVKHKIISPETKEFTLQLLKKWRPKTRLFELINTIKKEFIKKKPQVIAALQPITKPELRIKKDARKSGVYQEDILKLEDKLNALEKEIDYLQKEIEKKDEEIIRLQSYIKVHELPP
ncbi:MAG: ubiquitin-conjugating enzyme E2 [Candidatus Odinarchaeia archaeon]